MSRKYIKFIYLGLFLLVILVPAVILGILAVRALNHEEAYLEKNIKTTLMSEVNLSAGRVRNELNTIQSELLTALELQATNQQVSRIKDLLSTLKKQNPLIDVSFLISAERKIEYPIKTGQLNENELSFLTANEPFFKDKITIPVYKNIALAYINEIIETDTSAPVRDDYKADNKLPTESLKNPRSKIESRAETRVETKTETKPLTNSEIRSDTSDTKTATESLAKTETESATASVTNDLIKARTVSPLAVKEQLPIAQDESAVKEENQSLASTDRQLQADAEQQALSRFEQDKTIQEKIYKRAEQKGEELLQRNVTIEDKIDRLPQEQKSIFIAQPGNFSQIISTADSGMIPRTIDEQFTLIFWKKYTNKQIAGCTLNYRALCKRLASVLPAAKTDFRILALLDANGLPLFAPTANTTITRVANWRLPFAASEIAEILPRWEIAGYLQDPERISRQALNTAYLLGLLIMLLLAVLTMGGLLLVRLFFSEINLAQKKTNFVANVSHELKTPLTSIRLFTEILKEQRQPDKEKQHKYFELMLSETERLTRLINNVLDFSRLEQNKKTFQLGVFEIGAVLNNFLESQRLHLEQNGFRLTFTGLADALYLTSDEEALKQVLLNLLSNAEKYSFEKKEMDVELERNPDFLFIRVKDRGSGVPKHARPKLFKEFYRADDSLTARVPGSGLGLAISRRLVRELGGDILYAPREGSGSIFTIKLPITGKENAPRKDRRWRI